MPYKLKPEQLVHRDIVAWMRQEPRLKGILFLHPANEWVGGSSDRWLFNIMGCHRGASDLIIFEENEEYRGLVAEIKVENPFYQNGRCKFPEQLDFIEKMRLRGYQADFTVGYQNTKKFISEYFGI